ncbi:MAG TPA: hypothetical protein VHF06_15755 [Pseudonocardiaceae bacterium]|jgi:hypothetical protein|nr:hypothetical protein [Pseudonocardiaceae bacterium]
MSERSLSAQFAAALSDEPPLGFDPDELIIRASRLLSLLRDDDAERPDDQAD